MDGLDACKNASNWTVDAFKKLITGLQPMVKHCLTVHVSGGKRDENILQKNPCRSVDYLSAQVPNPAA